MGGAADMSDDASRWVEKMVANLEPSSLSGSPGELRLHIETLAALNKRPATDAEAILIFDHHMADDESWFLAKDIVRAQLTRCIALHPLLSRMAALMLLGDKAKEDRRPALHERDEIVVALMAALKRDHGIAPTRNRTAKHSNSGADIVARAMNRRGFNVTPDALMKVWTERRKEFD